MGLGSEEQKKRTVFRDYVGKHDWKATVNSPDDARALINKIKDNLMKDPNGQYFMDAYAGPKIRLLEAYIANNKIIPLKQFKP